MTDSEIGQLPAASLAPPPRAPILRLLLVAAWIFCVVMFAKYVAYQPYVTERGVDFEKHHIAAERVLRGESPMDGELFLCFNYPTFTALIFLFLALFDVKTAEIVWDYFHILMIILSLVVFIWGMRPKLGNLMERRSDGLSPPVAEWVRRHWISMGALAFFVFTPGYDDLSVGNIQPLNLFLVVLLCALARNKRDLAAGVALAALCLIKIVPVFLVPVFVIAGRRRVFYGWLISMGVYGLLLAATGWWRWDWYLLTETLPNVGYRWRDISHSLTALVAWRIPDVYESKPLYDLVGKSLVAGLLVIHGVLYLLGWKRYRRSWEAGLIFTSLLTPLLSPLLEFHHFCFAFSAWALVIVGFVEGRVSKMYFWISMTLWLGVFVGQFLQDLSTGLPFWALCVGALSLLLLWFHTGLSAGFNGEQTHNEP